MGNGFKIKEKKQMEERKIAFDGPKAAKHFEYLLTALRSAGDGKGQRDKQRVRKEARLFDLLDSVSIEENGMRTLKKESLLTFAVKQEDYELMTQYLDTTPWMPGAAQGAVSVQDWWEAAEVVKPAEDHSDGA